jgi:hypothetical protein
MDQHTTTTQEAPMPYTALARDDAATLTFERLASEVGGTTYLSADIVAYDNDDNPIVSVIHLDDRRHWNLTVRTGDPAGVARAILPGEMPDVLLAASDGDLILVLGDAGWWTLTVEILEPARLRS